MSYHYQMVQIFPPWKPCKKACCYSPQKNFVFPFLAHALGTLAGAFVAAKIAASHKMRFALAIGFLFLLGGRIYGENVRRANVVQYN